MIVPQAKHTSYLLPGFTFIELLLVMSMTAILLGIVTMNLLRVQNSTTLRSRVDSIISDLREQQIKAMLGDTEGRISSDNYGIHFTSSSYTLFHGTVFSVSDTSNRVIALESDLTNTTGTKDIIFSRVSGNPAAGTSLTLKDTATNQQKTITLNSLGVVTIVN